MKKIIFTLMALFTMACGTNAKNVYTTTTLWEDTQTDNIAISKNVLAANVTITVSLSFTDSDDGKLHVFYCKNDQNWSQTALSSVSEWIGQSNGTKTYSFILTEDDFNTISGDDSQGYLYIGSENLSKMKITKITKTYVSGTEKESSTTTIWSTETVLEQYGGVSLGVNLSSAKKGDVFRVTATNAGAGNLLICNADGWGVLMTGTTVAKTEAQTVELEITSATNLEIIQQKGIVVKTEASGGATITKVELLTYASSYDCVPATVGSDGIATFSSTKDLDFSGTGVTPYYVSAIATGTVTLTAATNATTWNYCGYILQGSEGTYDVPVTASATYPVATHLKGQTSQGTVYRSVYSEYSGDATEDELTKIKTWYRYILAKHNSEIGFYKLTTDDHTLGAHKAYLETEDDITPTTGAGARALIIFDDGQITSINSVQERKVENGIYYNLKGQRIQNPAKGLYIVNGKKVVVR